jgi:hypothetical protein
MIARFRILLPYILSIPCLDKLEQVHFTYGEYQITAFVPTIANTDSSVSDITSSIPIIDAISNLHAQKIVSVTQAIKINGQETIQANLLEFDFLARREFDRRKQPLVFDPTLEDLFVVANSVIGRLRTVGRLSEVFYLGPETVPGWKVEYLSDNGEPLAQENSLRRSHFQSRMRTEVSGVTASIWSMAFGLPVDYSPDIWDSLILDARAQLPDVNASIVLANAALESFISLSLDVLAQASSLDEESWKWIINRDESWLKQPSVKEKFNQVLFLLTGRSLERDQRDLSKAFDELRGVRNSIVHEGRAVITRRTNKKKRRIETFVDAKMAEEMITNAESIIAWVEEILPERARRTLFKGQTTFEFNRDMTGADSKVEHWGLKSDAGRVKLTPKIE